MDESQYIGLPAPGADGRLRHLYSDAGAVYRWEKDCKEGIFDFERNNRSQPRNLRNAAVVDGVVGRILKEIRVER